MKVLIVSQHIFPIQTPRAHRTTELMKELAQQGHDVTVYAVLGKYDYSEFVSETGIKLKNIPLKWSIKPYTSDEKTERHIIDKVLGKLLAKSFEFPDIEFKHAIAKILEQDNKYDLLISIANPHQIHWGCAKAKRKIGSSFPKWIADCGDPFMANNTKNYHKPKFEKDEREFCELADFITVPVEDADKLYYKEYREKIRVIPQGFNFEIPEKINTDKINEVPTFIFAGTFLSDIRNPTLLLNHLSKTDFPFKFVIHTKYTELVDPFREKLEGKLEVHGLISRTELLDKMSKMDFLLNLENVNSKGQTPSKLIDYAIAARPILSINPSAPDFSLVDEFLAGNYTRTLEVKNIEQFKIQNVVQKFLSL